MSVSFKVEKSLVVELPTTCFREIGNDCDGYPVMEEYETTGQYVECSDGFREVYQDQEGDYYGSCCRDSVESLPKGVELLG